MKSYRQLKAHDAFQKIRDDFLTDIKQLNLLARDYVGQQFEQAMETFHDRISTPPDHMEESLLPLYRDVRFQINQLVLQLAKCPPPSNGDLQNGQNRECTEQITTVLHDCLSGINQCPAGIHSRFASSFLNLEAAQDGLGGTLFRVRNELFREFIKSFLFQQKRENVIEYSQIMEVHWFNSLYNLYCESLSLPSVEDPLAHSNLNDEITRRFLCAVPLHINSFSILRHLAGEWSDKMTATLQQLGVSAWQTDPIEPTDMTADKTEKLDSTVFKPVNQILGTTEAHTLDFWTVAEMQDDGSYRLDRFREKLFAFATDHFCGSNTIVFAELPGTGDSKTYIGTIDGVYFWVFEHDKPLHQKQHCTFESSNHITLQLSHLTSLDLSSWPDTTSLALLTQAMSQTDRADVIASFFLNPGTIRELVKMPRPVIEMLSSQMTEKLHKNDANFKQVLCGKIISHLTGSAEKTVSARNIQWLLDTPLLEPVLSELSRCGVDTSSVTGLLNTWQVSDFSKENMKKILSPEEYQRLFVQSLRLSQVRLMTHLLLAGHCDELAEHRSDEGITPLGAVATSGLLEGLQYLLKLPNTQPGRKDRRGRTPLHCAARNGHWQCVQELLKNSDVWANEPNNVGETALHNAARQGHFFCIRELLKSPDILVNIKNNKGCTALNIAAKKGHSECVRELVCAEHILVNEGDDNDWTPLHNAAYYGHHHCVSQLLQAGGIRANKRNQNRWTALVYAAKNGHWQCIRALLRADGAMLNEKNGPDDWTALHTAAYYGQNECIRELINSGSVHINEKSRTGWTPLHMAVREGHHESIRALLQGENVYVNQRSPDGWQPIQTAASQGFHECVRELIKSKNIRVNERNINGSVALELAARNGHHLTVRELIRAENIRVNDKSSGWTALNSAVINGHHQCVQELLSSHRVELNIRSPHRMKTALMLAVEFNRTECFKLLIQSDRIRINKIDRSLGTALTEARKRGLADFVELMETDPRLNRRLDQLLKKIVL